MKKKKKKKKIHENDQSFSDEIKKHSYSNFEGPFYLMKTKLLTKPANLSTYTIASAKKA